MRCPLSCSRTCKPAHRRLEPRKGGRAAGEELLPWSTSRGRGGEKVEFGLDEQRHLLRFLPFVASALLVNLGLRHLLPSRAALQEELWKLFISAEWRASKADDVTAARRRQEGGEQLWGSHVGLFVLIFTPFKLGNGARQLNFEMCKPHSR